MVLSNPLRIKEVALLGGDRSRALHFAGRRRELAALHARLEYVVRERDAEDGIVLIDGIQGIGKTGLLREFAQQAVSNPSRYGQAGIVHLPLVADELSVRPADLAATLLNSIPSVVPKDVTGAKREVSRAFAWIRRTVKRGPGFELRVREDLPLNQLLRESLDLGWWDDHALLLTTDEIQNIDGDGRRNLATLHEGKHGCPILMICAGLQHSRQVLQEPMTTTVGMPSPTISRCSTLTLAMLSQQEAAEAVRMSVRKARDQPLPDGLAQRLAAESLGFPQHVHGYVQACLDACNRFGGLNMADAKEWALAEGDRSRRRYYEGRLRSFSPDEGIVLSQIAALARDDDGRIAWHAAAQIGDAADIDTTGRQLLTSAIHKGVLSLVEGSTNLTFPIPSLMNHLADRVAET